MREPIRYVIRVEGRLDARWSGWFMGLRLENQETGDTLLSGTLPDQAALHGVLDKIRDLNLTLISVTGIADTPPGSA